MNRSLTLLLEIGEISEQHLLTETARVFPQKRAVWPKWIAVAVCLTLFAAVTGIVLLQRQSALTPPLENDPSSLYVSTQMAAPVTISTEELIERADIIVTATVVSEQRRPLEPKEQLYITDSVLNDHCTDNVAASYYLTVDVQATEILKGDLAKGAILRLSNSALEDVDTAGNRIGFFHWSDATLMKQGDRVLLFLKAPLDGTDEHLLVGEAGKWFLDTDGTYRCGLLYDDRFPEEYTPRIGLTDYTPRTLEEWRSMITAQ